MRSVGFQLLQQASLGGGQGKEGWQSVVTIWCIAQARVSFSKLPVSLWLSCFLISCGSVASFNQARDCFQRGLSAHRKACLLLWRSACCREVLLLVRRSACLQGCPPAPTEVCLLAGMYFCSYGGLSACKKVRLLTKRSACL